MPLADPTAPLPWPPFGPSAANCRLLKHAFGALPSQLHSPRHSLQPHPVPPPVYGRALGRLKTGVGSLGCPRPRPGVRANRNAVVGSTLEDTGAAFAAVTPAPGHAPRTRQRRSRGRHGRTEQAATLQHRGQTLPRRREESFLTRRRLISSRTRLVPAILGCYYTFLCNNSLSSVRISWHLPCRLHSPHLSETAAVDLDVGRTQGQDMAQQKAGLFRRPALTSAFLRKEKRRHSSKQASWLATQVVFTHFGNHFGRACWLVSRWQCWRFSVGHRLELRSWI